MIDLILIGFFLGVFYGGFVAGKKYSSISEMLKSWINAVK